MIKSLDGRWVVSPSEGIAIQRALRHEVIRRWGGGRVRLVAGADVHFPSKNRALAAVTILRYPDLELIEYKSLESDCRFPYIPGLLSFREIPALIEVFDSQGASLYSIQQDYDKVPITREKRRELEESLRLDPYMNISPDSWEQFRSQTKMIYPDDFPAIQDFFIADNRIYVQTFKRQDDKNQFIILDLKGHTLGEVDLPKVRMPGFTERMMGTGVRLYCIDQNRYYYIVEKDEGCEVHVAEIGSLLPTANFSLDRF